MEKLRELKETIEKKLQEMDENNSKSIITRIKLENMLSEINSKIDSMNTKSFNHIKEKFDEIVDNLENDNSNTFTLFKSNIITKEEVIDRIINSTICRLEKDFINEYKTILNLDNNQSSIFMFNVVKLIDYIKGQVSLCINNYELA